MTAEIKSPIESITLSCISPAALELNTGNGGLLIEHSNFDSLDEITGFVSMLSNWREFAADLIRNHSVDAASAGNIASCVVSDAALLSDAVGQVHDRGGDVTVKWHPRVTASELATAFANLLSDHAIESGSLSDNKDAWQHASIAEVVAGMLQDAQPEPEAKLEPGDEEDEDEDQEEYAVRVNTLNVLEFGDCAEGWGRDDAASFLQCAVPEMRRSMTLALDYCREHEFDEGNLIETVQCMANDLDDLSAMCARIIETGDRERVGPCAFPHHLVSVVRLCTFVGDGSYSSFWNWAIEPRLTALQAQPTYDEVTEPPNPRADLGREIDAMAESLIAPKPEPEPPETFEQRLRAIETDELDNMVRLGKAFARIQAIEAAVFEDSDDDEPDQGNTPTNGSANWDVPGRGEDDGRAEEPESTQLERMDVPESETAGEGDAHA